MRRITDPAELLAYRLSYVPRTVQAQKITAKLGEAVAWVWSEANGTPYAVVFLGKSQHPYSGASGHGSVHRFKSADSRRAWIAKAFETAAYIVTRKATRRAEVAAQRAAGHKLTVGAILRSSWGYDQTNVDYYQVTALVGSTMVEVREIGCQSEETGWLSGKCVPAPGSFIGEPARYRVSPQGDSIRIASYASAYLMAPVAEVAGVKMYGADSWSSYA
jgi:hypothetical protein